MATKTITVTEEGYKAISSLKHKDESFSKLFGRLAKEKNVAKKYFGILSKENADELHHQVKKIRKELSKDFEQRQDVLFR
mgnify:CR=1 FL=1|tara:strand:- start:215 stop:454 length:240 start_codon:yes stop_codon:yes gene_type:complete